MSGKSANGKFEIVVVVSIASGDNLGAGLGLGSWGAYYEQHGRLVGQK